MCFYLLNFTHRVCDSAKYFIYYNENWANVEWSETMLDAEQIEFLIKSMFKATKASEVYSDFVQRF